MLLTILSTIENESDRRIALEIYSRYSTRMKNYAYSILRNEHDAEDAVQEAFLKLMKSNVDFKDAKSDECKQYIITIIKHASIDIYNRKKREQELIFFSDENSDFDRSKPEALDEQQQQIREVMDKLPAKYYSVVNCMVVKELSVKETANELSISEDNVRKRFERAKLLLKTIMKGCGGYEESRAV